MCVTLTLIIYVSSNFAVSVFQAIGICAYELYDEIDFNAWCRTFLLPLLNSEPGPNDK